MNSEITDKERLLYKEMLVILSTDSRYSFYAHILLAINTVLTKDIETCCVAYKDGGFHLKVNPAFLFEFLDQGYVDGVVTSDKDKINLEQMIVMVHEILHILYMHNFRVDGRDHKIWNYACDLTINQHLLKRAPTESVLHKISVNIGKDFPFPEGLTAEQYYELLVQSGFQPPKDPNKMDGDVEPSSDSISDVEKEMIKQELQSLANRAKAKCRGNIGNEAEQVLDFLNSTSKVDWRNELRYVTGNKKTFKEHTIKRRDRRQPSRMDLQGSLKRNGFNIATLLDVSGSMDNGDVIIGLGEIKDICELTQSGMILVQVDTDASEPEVFDGTSPTFSRKRSGGTYLYPGVEKLYEREVEFDALVVITDGEIESHWPEVLDIPVFFLVVGGSRLNFDISVSEQYKTFRLED